MGFAGPVVEVLNGNVVVAGWFVECGGEGAAGRLVADDGLTVGGSLPGFDVDRSVPSGRHVLGFDAVGVVAYAVFFVRNAGFFLEPFGDGIAPDDGVPSLIGEQLQGLVVTLVIDEALESLPARDVGFRGGCPIVVSVIDILDYSFAVVQNVRVRNVMHEEEEVVGAGVDVFVDLGEFRRVLANVSGSSGDGAIHANAGGICAKPLAPAVTLGGLDTGAEVIAEDVSERADAEVARVLLVDVPRVALQLVDSGDNCRIIPPSKARPGVEDLVSREVGVPGELAEAIEIGHGHGVMHPVGIETNVSHAHKSAERLMERFAFDNLFDRRASVVRAHIGIERGLPHRNEKDHMPLLPEILLRYLQLNRLRGVLKRRKKRRRGLANLKIDRPILNLNNYIRFKLPVEGMEVVIPCARAISLKVVVVQMIVVDESPIQHDSAVRFQRAGNCIGGLGWRPPIFRRPKPPF